MERRTVISLLVIAATTLCRAATPLPAQNDDGVYGPRASEDTGFVRLLAAVPSLEKMETRLGSHTFGPLEFGEMSAYRPLAADIYIVREPGTEVENGPAAEAELILRPGTYMTVAVVDGDINVFEDRRHEDPARAQLILYNLAGGEAADLLVAPDGPAVLESVAVGSSDSRAVNAVVTDLAVHLDGEEVATFTDVELNRGESYALFVLDGENGPEAFLQRAEVRIEE
ncbi:MAG: alginate O-acetyltransferase AlgF [Spirochaetaceae bacterium]